MSAIENEHLLHIEEIRQLKAWYCIGVDSKDWQLYRSVFADDARLGGGLPGGSYSGPVGPEQWVAGVAEAVGTIKTLHTLHASVVEITGPDLARGLWQYTQRGWGRTGGYYLERYVRREGGWKISSMQIVPVFANDGADASECLPGSFEQVAALWPTLIEAWRAGR